MWLSAQRMRPVLVASTGSARPSVSSLRSRSTADVAYAAPTRPASSMRAARYALVMAAWPPILVNSRCSALLVPNSWPMPLAAAPQAQKVNT